jgi:hypothetical protein
MRLKKRYRDKLTYISGYLSGLLEQERKESGTGKEEYISDPVYGAILRAMNNIDDAIDAEDAACEEIKLLINNTALLL